MQELYDLKSPSKFSHHVPLQASNTFWSLRRENPAPKKKKSQLSRGNVKEKNPQTNKKKNQTRQHRRPPPYAMQHDPLMDRLKNLTGAS